MAPPKAQLEALPKAQRDAFPTLTPSQPEPLRQWPQELASSPPQRRPFSSPFHPQDDHTLYVCDEEGDGWGTLVGVQTRRRPFFFPRL